MNRELMKKKATEILSCPMDKLEEKAIPEQNVIYYRNIDRGGGALIVSKDGEMLFADPFFVDFDEHLQKFISGERTHFE